MAELRNTDVPPVTTPPGSLSAQTKWLELAPGVSMSFDFDEWLRLDRKGFAALYRRHVCGAKRREAKRWADGQIREREALLWAAT